MPNEHTLEPSSSATEPVATEPVATEPVATEPVATEPSLVDTSNPFRFLQTGAQPLDELLRASRVPKGGAIYLDFHYGIPVNFLLAIGKAALRRGERVIYLSVPTLIDMSEEELQDEKIIADLRTGRTLEFEFSGLFDTYGLAPYFNAARPDDPEAALRHLTANTFDEFEATIDSLLSNPATAPDQVLVYGLDQLAQNVRVGRWMHEEDEETLCYWMQEGNDETDRVQAHSARLRAWLKEAGPRLEDAGMALWLSRMTDSYTVDANTPFTRGLRPLLYANCATTLFLEKSETTCECGGCPWALPDVGGLPITLYRGDVLEGFTFAPVLVGDDGFDGPFLDGEPDVETTG